MTAHALNRARPSARRLAFAATGLVLLVGLTPTKAAVGADISVLSDDMFRGRSVSGGRPVVRLGLSYDDLTGPYAGASATGVLAPGNEAQLLSVQEYAGYAHRLQPELTLDLGVVHTDYSRYWSGERGATYTEFYAGLIGRRINGRMSLSPNYLGHGWKAGYGEINGVLISSEAWDMSVHGGVLLWIAGGRPEGASLAHYDWQISGGRRLGRLQIRAAWTWGGPQSDYYRGKRRRRGAPTISIAASF